jgi:hypothetical protein
VRWKIRIAWWGTYERKNRNSIGGISGGGGIVPSLAELVSLCKHESMPALPFFIGAAVMGVMGMAIVLIAKETIPWKAFTQGIGAPALFSSATTAATSVAVLLSPIPEVYAQDSFDSVSRSGIQELRVGENHADTAVIIINKEMDK